MSKLSFTTNLSYSLVDNSNPFSSVKKLIPTGLKEIEITELEKPQFSEDLLFSAKKYGFDIYDVPFPIYSKGKVGTPRAENNKELPNGYPMYGADSLPLDIRLDRMKVTRNKIIEFNKNFLHKAENFDERLRVEEEGDANKFTFQRTRRFGRHLSLPYSQNLQQFKGYSKEFLMILKAVCKHYIDGTKGLLPTRKEAILSQEDAIETAPGAPLFASGDEDYHLKRMAALLVMPVPDYKEYPLSYLNKVYDMGSSIGMPHRSMTLAPYLSFRQGAKVKPQLLWYNNGFNYAARYEATSMESNQRLVFPGPFVLNIIMSPAVYLMKLFRKRKLGMYHNPLLASKYIEKLRKQGSICYVSDFSNYDMTISNWLLRFVCNELANSEYSWEFKFFSEYLDDTGVVYPSYHASAPPSEVTFLKGPVSLLSGWLLTSELGSIISVAINLFALWKQIPSILTDWVTGKFIILVQSDDVLFTLPKEIDEEQFTKDVATLGVDTKLMQGTTFLKKMLPLGYLAKQPGPARLISRLVQQTFGNEDNYSGKPDAIVRLGLVARSEDLKNNPIWKNVKPEFQDMLRISEIYDPIIDSFDNGLQALSQEDIATIQEYGSTSGLPWFSQLMTRADSDPSAAGLIASMSKLGINFTNVEETLKAQREQYYNALMTANASKYLDGFLEFAPWRAV